MDTLSRRVWYAWVGTSPYRPENENKVHTQATAPQIPQNVATCEAMLRALRMIGTARTSLHRYTLMSWLTELTTWSAKTSVHPLSACQIMTQTLTKKISRSCALGCNLLHEDHRVWGSEILLEDNVFDFLMSEPLRLTGTTMSSNASSDGSLCTVGRCRSKRCDGQDAHMHPKDKCKGVSILQFWWRIMIGSVR